MTTQGPRSNLVLGPIIVNVYGPVIEVGLQLCPALQAVIQGSADRLGGEPYGVGDHLYKSRRKVA